MHFLSKHKIFATLALVLCLAAIFGWTELRETGFIHDLFEGLAHLLYLFVGLGFALFSTDSASFRSAPPVDGDTPVSTACEARIANPKVNFLTCLRSIPMLLNTVVKRPTVLAFKGLWMYIIFFVALPSLVDAYKHGGIAAWSGTFLLASTALSYGLAVILQAVTPANDRPRLSGSQTSNQNPSQMNSAEVAAKFKALFTLLASQIFLSIAIAFFIAALKHSELKYWWACGAGAGASFVFAVLFLRVQLRCERQKAKTAQADSAEQIADAPFNEGVPPTKCPAEPRLPSPEKPSQLQAPTPREVDKIAKAWQVREEERTRKQFEMALPDFQKRIIAEIKEKFGQPHDFVIIYEPDEISKRPDLIESQIIQWLRSRGWTAEHEWREFMQKYGLTVRR